MASNVTRCLSSPPLASVAGILFMAMEGSSKGLSTTSGSTTAGVATDLLPRRCGFFPAAAAGALPAGPR